MDQTTLMIFGIAMLAALGIGGVGFVFVGGEKQSDKRLARVAGPSRATRQGKVEADTDNGEKRRKQVQDTLKGLEEKQRAEKQKVTLALRIERAGLTISTRTFYMMSAIAGLMVASAVMIYGFSFLVAIMSGFVGAVGLPRWVLNWITTRRQKAFTEEFANSIDIIVRGVKSGLPINDCLRIIATESPEPVRSEFRDIVEGQRLGITLEQGLERIYERMPLAEVNFFQIVISIQQKTGGNLAEALGNLSKVLRDRKKMRGKIRAMSQEAVASAGIIGSLPPGVLALILVMSPTYIDPLLQTTIGNVILAGGVTWMLIGILVMRQMINFKF